MEHTYHQIADVINFIGFAIIIVGSLRGLLSYVLHEGASLLRKPSGADPDAIRAQFGAYLLLGLEFAVAADVILTLLEPDNEKLIQLGALIAIRTVIAFFVGRERAELREVSTG